jgi:YVTN family beta-propeller protein
MTQAYPALLSILAAVTLVAADKPAASGHAPVRDAAWMNERPADNKMVYSGQQLDTVGQLVDVPGRLLAVEFAQGGKILLVKTTTVLASLDAATMKLIQKAEYPIAKAGGSMHGLAVAKDGASVLVSGGRTHLYRATVSPDGVIAWGPSIDVSAGAKNVNPLGLALTADGKRALVALSMTNQLALVDLTEGKLIGTVTVGVCPYGVALSADGKTAYVSNFGGNAPGAEDLAEASGGTMVAVDKRTIPLRGTLSFVQVDGTSLKESGRVEVGLHPSELLLDAPRQRLFVANVGGDSVSVIDTTKRKVTQTLDTKPDHELPWGMLTDGLALSADGRTLYAANAGINAIACLDLAAPKSAPKLIPSGWYPGAVRVRDGQLYVANVRNGLQKVAVPADAKTIAEYDARARAAAHLAHALRYAKGPGTTTATAAPVPVPAEVGQPSSIKHVVYIIKENRTFDQVLGDIGRGNAEPKLVLFPRDVTPNHHAIAERWPLLDNYYCNGVNSSDGHAWASQGIVGPYREKDRVGFRCAYDFGTDALFFAGCGFIWDHALLHGRSFRNYGEMDKLTKIRGKTYDDFFTDRQNGGGKTAFTTTFFIDALRRYSCPGYPGWDMAIPDQTRADVFLKDLAEHEKKGSFPDLTIIYLPNDHTANELTAKSYVADNDLALGRVIEGLSKSRFWKDMAIFVNEDDPQTGGDHVDGHRSFCLVVSPYAKKGALISKFYNQTSVLHTICRILGMPPLNQVVAASTTMEDCFTTQADLTPYAALTPKQKLNEKRPPAAKKTGFWPPFLIGDDRLTAQFEALDFSGPDRIDDDTLNRAIWAQTRPGERYPREFMGAHGKGLKALGLQIDPEAGDDDDDE